MNRSLWLLTLCQGLFLTNNVCFITINGLVGLSLAPYGWMATLPIMAYLLGGALSSPLVAYTQKRFGRQFCFQLGLGVALLASLVCAYAVSIHSFWLLCFAILCAGFYNANALLYRYAAAELVAPESRDKTVSWVLAGGLLGAVLGPNLALVSRNSMATPFMGSYLALAALAVFAMLVMRWIRFPTPQKSTAQSPVGRSLAEISRQPLFIVSTLCAALGYGVMSLIMSATPIAMQLCGLDFGSVAQVIEWHVVGMFAPGFFTGGLIKRYGAYPILILGLLLNFLCIVIALTGIDFAHFLFALLLLGVGWNFLFTASTTLLMDCYRPEEKDKVQSANNFWILLVQVFAAFASGALVNTQGWAALNWGSIAPLCMMLAAVVYMLLSARAKRRFR